MNKTLTMTIGALIAIAGYAAPALAADVGVSIGIGQPGFYGQLDIGDAPRPRVIYAQPRIIDRVVVDEEPIYLHVRPGHAKNWRRYCGQYNACGRRVYFVNDNYYNNVYAPHYRQRHERQDDRHDDRHDHGDRRDDNGHDDHHDRGNEKHNRH